MGYWGVVVQRLNLLTFLFGIFLLKTRASSVHICFKIYFPQPLVFSTTSQNSLFFFVFVFLLQALSANARVQAVNFLI